MDWTWVCTTTLLGSVANLKCCGVHVIQKTTAMSTGFIPIYLEMNLSNLCQDIKILEPPKAKFYRIYT